MVNKNSMAFGNCVYYISMNVPVSLFDCSPLVFRYTFVTGSLQVRYRFVRIPFGLRSGSLS